MTLSSFSVKRIYSFAATAAATALPVVAAGVLGGFLTPNAAHAQHFNPASTSSLGAFPQAAGTYTIDTTGIAFYFHGTTTYYVSITGPNSYHKLGVIQNGCALFTFDSITVGSDQHLVGAGSRPLVLLSKSSVVVNTGGTISVDGSPGVGFTLHNSEINDDYGVPGGAGGAGGGAGGDSLFNLPYAPAKAGTGPGSSSPNNQGSGAGFGGNGGAGYSANNGYPTYGYGGTAYGPAPSSLLQGGSGAGGTDYASGGGGGGAVEISATTFINIHGTVSAAGGSGAQGSRQDSFNSSLFMPYFSGGGSGGEIYLVGPTGVWVANSSSTFNLRGGNALYGTYQFSIQSGLIAGGAGGGGRMRVEYNGATPSTNAVTMWTQPGSDYNSAFPNLAKSPPKQGVFEIALVTTPIN